MDDMEQGGSSENRRKRLLFRAQRRGFKEVDLIFGAYAEGHLARLDAAGLDQFEALLTAPDQDVYAWLRGAAPGGPLPSLRDVEMRHIERVLQEARGNQRRASRILGISRWSLSRRLRKYGMQARAEE